MAAKSGRKQFWAAFFLGIVILSLPFSYALFKFSRVGEPKEEKEESYFPQSSDSIRLLLALKDNFGMADSFVLTDISPQKSTVTIAVIPPEIPVEDGGSFRSAGEVWESEGAKRGVAAIESALGTTVDRWLELDRQAVAKLGSVVGAIDFTPWQAVSLENGLLTLPAQRQLIDGMRAALLIGYKGYSGGEMERLEMTARLAEQMIYQRLPLMNDSVLLKLFETAVNSGSSNLAIGDFESRRRALNQMCGGNIKVEIIAVLGEYSDDGESFFLSSQSLADIKAGFEQND